MIRNIVYAIIFAGTLGSVWVQAQTQHILSEEAKNGDFILFEDLDFPHQFLYRTFEGNPISHVGLVIEGNKEEGIGEDGEKYIMHAVGKHAFLTRSINPSKKEGIVIDPLVPYIEEALKSKTDQNRVYIRVKRKEIAYGKERDNFYGWARRMLGRPYDSAAADRLFLKPVTPLFPQPINPLPFYKEKPEIIEPKSASCSGFLTSFCISGHLISPPINRPNLQKMTRAEYGAWVNYQATTPPDFLKDTRLNLGPTYNRAIQIVIPKETPPKNKK